MRVLPAALVALALAGCEAPHHRAHADLPSRMEGVRAVGVVAPCVTVYTEQVGGALPTQELVPDEEASRALNRGIRDALVDLGARSGRPVAAIEPQDVADRMEIEDLLDLFAVVDLAISLHAYGDSQEAFPAKERRFEYSLGSAAAFLDWRGLDAAWLVTGFVLVPTTGAQIRDAVEILLAILSAAGGGPGVTTILPKVEIRAALIGRDGVVLFFTRLRFGDFESSKEVETGERALGRGCVERILQDLDEAIGR